MISELSNEFVCVKDPVRQAREWKEEDFQGPVEDVAPDPSTLEVYDYMVEKLAKTLPRDANEPAQEVVRQCLPSGRATS